MIPQYRKSVCALKLLTRLPLLQKVERQLFRGQGIARWPWKGEIGQFLCYIDQCFNLTHPFPCYEAELLMRESCLLFGILHWWKKRKKSPVFTDLLLKFMKPLMCWIRAISNQNQGDLGKEQNWTTVLHSWRDRHCSFWAGSNSARRSLRCFWRTPGNRIFHHILQKM